MRGGAGSRERPLVDRDVGRRGGRYDTTLVVCLLAATLPLLASVLRAWADHYVPASDWAVIEMQVRAVGTATTPLVGAWSRFGWDHPGPLPFYILAVPYRLLGSSPLGIQVGAIAINGTAILGTVALLRRHGRATAVLGTAGLLLLQFGLLENHLRNEWNASLAVLPFVFLVVAAWDAWDGSPWSLVAAPLAATFVMQTHVAYVAVGLPAFAVWLGALWRRRCDRRARRFVAIGLVLAALAWAPVALDVVLHWPGNLGHLARWTIANRGPSGGFAFATRLLGTDTSLRFPFVLGLPEQFLELDLARLGPAPGIGLALLVVLALLGRPFRDLRRLAGLLLATWLVGWFAAARLVGPRYPHLVWWSFPLSMLTWLAVALLAARLVRSRVAIDQRALSAVAALTGAATLVLSLLVVGRVARSEPMFGERRDAVVRLGDAGQSYLARHGRSEVVVDRTGDYIDKGAVQAGIIARLSREGTDAKVPARSDLNPSRPIRLHRRQPQFPDTLTRDHYDDDVVLLVAGRESLLDPPGRLLATEDPLTAAQRRTWLTDFARVRDVLARNGRRDLEPLLSTPGATLAVFGGPPELDKVRDSLQRLERLNRRGPVDLLWVASDPTRTPTPGGRAVRGGTGSGDGGRPGP